MNEPSGLISKFRSTARGGPLKVGTERTSRLMRNLEIDLVPHKNIAMVDLFDLRHTRSKRKRAEVGPSFGWPNGGHRGLPSPRAATCPLGGSGSTSACSPATATGRPRSGR